MKSLLPSFIVKILINREMKWLEEYIDRELEKEKML